MHSAGLGDSGRCRMPGGCQFTARDLTARVPDGDEPGSAGRRRGQPQPVNLGTGQSGPGGAGREDLLPGSQLGQQCGPAGQPAGHPDAVRHWHPLLPTAPRISLLPDPVRHESQTPLLSPHWPAPRTRLWITRPGERPRADDGTKHRARGTREHLRPAKCRVLPHFRGQKWHLTTVARPRQRTTGRYAVFRC